MIRIKLNWFINKDRLKTWTEDAIESGRFQNYQNVIMHDWLLTLTAMAALLVPLFFLLDLLMMPRELLPSFAIYRTVSTVLVLAQAIIVRRTKPGISSYFHGYFVSSQIGVMICMMTVDLGGFNSSYYAGLILVIVGVNLLMPWKAFHTGINSAMIVLLYVMFNLITPNPFDPAILANNQFFLIATSLLAMSINFVRYNLFQKEFNLLIELKKTKDSLWSEIELAKKIQTALLPRLKELSGYTLANTMIPAKQVGGDYFDIIETENGKRWVAIGDVAGHGVDSGLIMMMAQSSIMTLIKGNRFAKLSDILDGANVVLREDISRLGSNHYMSLMLLGLEDDKITAVGHHQDILIYRAAENCTEVLETKGTWLGIADNIGDFLVPTTFTVAEGDTILLFTDGATEGTNEKGEMYGQERLLKVFKQNAALSVDKCLNNVLENIQSYQTEQDDDISLIVLKRTAS